MRKFAEDTTVPIGKSRQEIDILLRNWGVSGIAWTDDFSAAHVQLRFVWVHEGTRYLARVTMDLPSPELLREQAVDGRSGKFSESKFKALREKVGRSEHRLLALWLKAALNAIDAGIIKAEDLFLPFLEDKNGVTVAEFARSKMPALMVGSAERLLPAGQK